MTFSPVAVGQVDLGVVRAIANLGDHDAAHRRAELEQRRQEQVVRERPRWYDAFECVMDRGRFGCADVDRQQAVTTVELPEQHHRCVRRDLDPHADQLERNHDSELSAAQCVRGRRRGTHHRRSQTTTDRLELEELLHGLGAGLGVALPQERLDELVEQTRLAIGRNTPPAEMTSVDAGRRGTRLASRAMSSASSLNRTSPPDDSAVSTP